MSCWEKRCSREVERVTPYFWKTASGTLGEKAEMETPKGRRSGIISWAMAPKPWRPMLRQKRLWVTVFMPSFQPPSRCMATFQ